MNNLSRNEKKINSDKNSVMISQMTQLLDSNWDEAKAKEMLK